jgi:hypothetical protein
LEAGSVKFVSCPRNPLEAGSVKFVSCPRNPAVSSRPPTRTTAPSRLPCWAKGPNASGSVVSGVNPSMASRCSTGMAAALGCSREGSSCQIHVPARSRLWPCLAPMAASKVRVEALAAAGQRMRMVSPDSRPESEQEEPKHDALKSITLRNSCYYSQSY